MSETTRPPRFSPRTLRWVLIGSLALNVLIIGAVVSTFCISHFDGPPHQQGFKSPPLLGFARTLPRERSDIVRQKVADAQPGLETARRGIRDARAAVRAALSAEPFDQAKFDAALDGIVEADTKEARAKATLFADTVHELTPQERIQLHEWLDKRRPNR
ncbi:periplasmic heavy metal sensor [Hyphomicrobium sp. NDB2Meth4]|uniref:periplasmic heavy metal sensor n=1 Tax=Hyphomicrobium sp. NDB2Meth4 TaxID=1892846 RepID=UPI000930FBB2|nr:periplasmic heavy metal sensor [Hyphomicrobium sp. NDB2Meth4]